MHMSERYFPEERRAEKSTKSNQVIKHIQHVHCTKRKKKGGRRRVSGLFLLKLQLYNHGSSTNKLDLGSELST